MNSQIRTYKKRNSIKNTQHDSNERPKKRRSHVELEDPTTLKRTRTLSGSRDLASSTLSDSPQIPTAPSSPVPESALEEDFNRLNKGKAKATNGQAHSVVLPDMVLDIPTSASQLVKSLPTTPSRKPKDLSGIFEAASPRGTPLKREGSQNSPNKSGITKKMLPRSRTESSIESSPTRSSQLTPKSKSFATVEQLSTQRNGLQRAVESPIASGSQPQRENASAGRTYAGKSRSFLVALPAASFMDRNGEAGIKRANLVDDNDEEFTRDSYAELRRRFNVDNSEDINTDSGEVDSGGEGLALYNPLSSITDLRSKGESRRFRDEVGYLFEGLEPAAALSVRRSSAFDIVSKLSDQDFWRRAKAAGLILDIWERLRDAGAGGGDKVLDPILCCFVSLASEDPRDMTLLASKEDFVETIIRLMVTHAANDPLILASSEKMKLTKAERLTLSRLCDMMSAKTNIVHEGCQSNTRLLLSFALSSASTFAFPHLSVILDSVLGDLASTCSRLAAYKSGVALFSDDSAESGAAHAHEKLCLNHVYNCLAILDLYLIETEAESARGLSLSKTEMLGKRYRALPSGLVALLAVSDIIERTETAGWLRAQGVRCSELAFRVLINLTNGSSTWTDAVAADPYALPTIIRLILTTHLNLKAENAAGQGTHVSSSSMDHLCLALALLTNLLQERDNLAFSLQNIMIDPGCKGQRACLLGCRCSDGQNAVSALVGMYISFLKGDDEDLSPDVHFLRGHLSVLIGLLLLQLHSPDNGDPASSIIDDLPGPPDSPLGKLDALITNVEIFSSLYASMTSKVSGSNRSRSRSRSRVSEEREESSSDSEGGIARNGSDVVADLVVSLRALRANL